MLSLKYSYIPSGEKMVVRPFERQDVSDEIAQLVVEVSRTIVSSSLTEPVESGVNTNRIEYTP